MRVCFSGKKSKSTTRFSQKNKQTNKQKQKSNTTCKTKAIILKTTSNHTAHCKNDKKILLNP